MKRLINISVLLLALVAVTFTSCKNEEDDLFNESAAQRLENAKNNFRDILLDKGGKWQLEYFTTEEEPGYIYLFSFNKNGSVVISGNNVYINQLTDVSASTPKFGSETSLWDVITDNGPVLTFNSYNKYFHLFADPEDIYSTETRETGYGHEGDYEFDLMKYSNDTLYVEGKKHGVKMIMTRVAPDVDDETYLNEVVALTDSFFSSKIPTVYLTLPTGKRFVVSNGASLLLKIYPEGGDWVSETEGYNAIITHDGLSFMNPLVLSDGDQSFSVQNFIRQPDGTLLCRDDGKTFFSADTLNKLIADKAIYWTVNTSRSSTGGFKQLLDQLNNQVKAVNKNNSVADIKLYQDPTLDVFVVSITLRLRVKVAQREQTVSAPCEYYGSISRQGLDLIKINLDGSGNKNTDTYGKNYSGMQDMLNYFASNTFRLESSSLLAPVVVTMEEQAQPANYMWLDVTKR